MKKYTTIIIFITIFSIFGDNRYIKLFVTSELHHIRHNGHQHNKLSPNIWTLLDKNHNKLNNNFYKSNEKLHHQNPSGILSDSHNYKPYKNIENFNHSNNKRNTDEYLYFTDSTKIHGRVKYINDISDKSIKCPKCSSINKVRVSEEELIELRIEFVKNQILQKLRLKERPNISVSGLPRPIYEGTTMQRDEKTMSKDLDDYYARTSQKFIFLDQEYKQCDRVNQSPSMCFSFKIDDDVNDIDVNIAELWVYKKPSQHDRHKQTLVVSELDQGFSRKYLPKAKPIAMQSADVEEGWIKIDIAFAIKKWFGNHQLNHILHITCQSCEMDTNEDLISTDKEYRPFIVIDTYNRRKSRRHRRSVNCSAGITECCREKLYISFADIGWDDWIIQPPGYNAYFCRGSCSSAASVTMNSSHHTSALRKVIYHRESNGMKPLELTPCCTGKQFSSLQLVYLDSNNTGTIGTLPNMVVESCGCT